MVFPHASDLTETPSYLSIIVLPLLTGIAGILGGAVGAFLSKRAEIQAIHSQLGHVVAEAKLTRQATKDVEGKIDQYYWQHQRIWEIKRDVYIDVVKQLGQVRAHLADVAAAATSKAFNWPAIPLKDQPSYKEQAEKSFSEAGKKFQESFERFIIAKTLVLLVAPPELGEHFKVVNNYIIDVRQTTLFPGVNADNMNDVIVRVRNLGGMLEQLVNLIYDDMVKGQERTAAPTPSVPHGT